MDKETVIRNLAECCKGAPKRKEILKALRKKRHYRDVAKIVGINHPNNCLSIIKQIQHIYRLVERKGPGIYEVIPMLKHINIEAEIRKALKKDVEKIKIKTYRKKLDTTSIKKDIIAFIQENFQEIPHPYDKTKIEKFELNKLKIIANNLIEIIEKPIEDKSLKGLNLRFFQAFADYFSIPRTKRSKLINVFANFIQLLEPLIKKIAFLKTKNKRYLKHSLDQKLIETVFSKFNANIKQRKENYWKNRSISEASIRFVYPFRHIEAHEAREYKVFEMEKVIYYFFASLIFIIEDFQKNMTFIDGNTKI